MNIYLQLFSSFFRIGGLTFGGGYSMMPMLQKECVEKFGWCTEQELMDFYALGQCTPGIIAVNTATFIGHKIKGIAGSIAAALGVITPSIIIITIIAMFIEGFMDLPVVASAFAAIRIAVSALIVSSVIKLFKGGVIDVPTFIIFLVVAFLTTFVPSVSPIIIVLGSAVCGLVLKTIKNVGGKK